MVKIRRGTIKDIESIKAIYGHSDVMPYIVDDGCPDIAGINLEAALTVSSLYFLIASDEDEVYPFSTDIAVFMFHPWNSVTFELHSAVLPQYRGAKSIQSVTLAGHWMFDHTPCQRVVTQIAVNNLPAIVLARRCGMKKIGNNEKSFLKNGVLIDQYLYGISKGGN